MAQYRAEGRRWCGATADCGAGLVSGRSDEAGTTTPTPLARHSHTRTSHPRHTQLACTGEMVWYIVVVVCCCCKHGIVSIQNTHPSEREIDACTLGCYERAVYPDIRKYTKTQHRGLRKENPLFRLTVHPSAPCSSSSRRQPACSRHAPQHARTACASQHARHSAFAPPHTHTTSPRSPSSAGSASHAASP